MTTNLAKWASNDGQITKSGLPNDRRAKFLPSVVGFAYDLLRYEYYLGNIGLALMADRTLGDLAIDLREGELRDPEIDRTQGHRPFAAFSLAFEIDYFTDPSDPYQPAP